VVGDQGHAEVEGVLSHTRGRGIVVSRPDDVDALPELPKVVVVAQTTQDEDLFARVTERLRQRYPGCLVFDTICRSTQKRQAEAKRMAQQVDVMIVVGGFNSANTRRLAQICSDAGTPTFHVETDWQLDVDRLLQYRRVGVTAGASTPHWMIRRVIRRLRSEYDRRRRSPSYLLRLILAGPIRANVFIGGGAAALTFANWRLMQLEAGPLGLAAALAFFFIMSQHLLSQYAIRNVMYLSDPDKGEFFRANAGAIWLLGVACCALAAFLAFLLGWLPFVLVLAGTAAGLLYRFEFGRRIGASLHVGSLEQVPGSKELFVALAWGVTTALIPALAAGGPDVRWRAVAVAIAFALLLSFHRTLLSDMRDVESDQLVGRETLASMLGDRACRGVLAGVLAAEVVLLAGLGGLLGWTSAISYGMLIPVCYSAVCSLMFHRGRLPEAELGEALIDGKFYACGLVALVYRAFS
jgi:4-hydroxy-3-methylbut-2-enyl diphosphate reductase